LAQRIEQCSEQLLCGGVPNNLVDVFDNGQITLREAPQPVVGLNNARRLIASRRFRFVDIFRPAAAQFAKVSRRQPFAFRVGFLSSFAQQDVAQMRLPAASRSIDQQTAAELRLRRRRQRLNAGPGQTVLVKHEKRNRVPGSQS
jgi:hypothetical protein